jgi:rod shape determining protein RodA
MEGTQSRLNFLPEKHTDFIFTTLAEEFGFVGAVSLLVALHSDPRLLHLYRARRARPVRLAPRDGDRGGVLPLLRVNMAMVMGLAPVVGVPLPLVSYGGSAMLVLMVAFGLVQSAHVHRPR